VRILTHLFSFYLPSTLYCVFHRFCYGGKFCVDFNTKGLVDATVACHPSFTNVASYDNLKAPILFNLAEVSKSRRIWTAIPRHLLMTSRHLMGKSTIEEGYW
jgi:hypothetical protein